jgi:hypothetical protein
MKAQIQAKTRNRGRDWIVFRRLDGKKKGVEGLAGLMAGDALNMDRRVRVHLLVYLA